MPASTDRPERGALILSAALFVVAYGTNISTPFLVLYKEALDLGPSETMAIFVVYVLGIMVTLLLVGPLSDRFGRRAVVLPMVAASAAGSVVMIFGREWFELLLLGRLLLGIASGGALGVGSAWLQELFGPGEEQRAAVATTLVSFGGFGIGPPVSALFHQFLPHPLVLPFLLHIALTAPVLVAAFGVPETRDPNPGSPLRLSFGVPAEAKRPFFLVVLPAAIWVFAFPSAGFALFPVLVSESIDGGEVLVAAGAGALTAWAGLSSRPLVMRIGPRRALPVGMFMGIAGYISGAVAFRSGTWPLALLAAPLLGAASGAITASSLTLLGAMADAERRGALTSTFYILAYPGMAMPLIITGLATFSSISAVLTGVTVVAVVCALGVTVVSRSRTLVPVA